MALTAAGIGVAVVVALGASRGAHHEGAREHRLAGHAALGHGTSRDRIPRGGLLRDRSVEDPVSSDRASVDGLDGFRLRGLRHASYAGDGTMLRIRAAEASLARVSLGFFRIGFAWRLAMRDAHVELGADPAWTGMRYDRAPPGGNDLDVDRRTRLISSVRVDGIHLRIVDPSGSWVALSGDRCEVGLVGSGRVVCQGRIELRSAGVRRAFRRLVFDVSRGRFVDARASRDRASRDMVGRDGRPPDGAGQRDAQWGAQREARRAAGAPGSAGLLPPAAALEDANAILRRAGAIDLQALHLNLGSLFPG